MHAYELGLFHLYSRYRTRDIKTRGFYILYPHFESQKRFFKEVFSEMFAFNQEQVMMARVR